MPRYVLGARATRTQRETLADLTATRYPEVHVDVRYTAHHDDGLDVWVCQAPSETHIRRWAAAADLDLQLLQTVDTEQQ